MGGAVPQYLATKPLLGREDQFAEVNISASTNNQQILSFTVRSGVKAYIVAFRQAWDSALNTSGATTGVALRLEANEVPLNYYNNVTVQLAPPEQDVYLPVPIEIPQGCRVRVLANNPLAVTGNVSARVIVFYE